MIKCASWSKGPPEMGNSQDEKYQSSVSNYDTDHPPVFQFFNIKLLNCTTCQGLDLHSTTYSKLLTQVDVKLSFLGANSTQLHAASHGCEATPIRCQWPIPWHAPVPPSPGTPSSSLVRKVHRKVRKGRMERVRNWGNGTHHPTPLLTANGLILRPHLAYRLWMTLVSTLQATSSTSIHVFTSPVPKSKTSSKSVEQTCRIFRIFAKCPQVFSSSPFKQVTGVPTKTFTPQHPESNHGRKHQSCCGFALGPEPFAFLKIAKS